MSNQILLTTDILDKYLAKGFGSMTKNDFEVFIFSELLKTKFKNSRAYQISRELHIPESKVKRLQYEASLRYLNKSEDDYKREFKDAAKKARKDNEKIAFVIIDIDLRKRLNDVLNEQGSYSCSLVNSDAFLLLPKDFSILLEWACTKEEKNQINSAIRKCELENTDWAGVIGNIIKLPIERLTGFDISGIVDAISLLTNKG